MSRIYAIHLLNDRSGSPFVFRQAIEALVESGNEIILYTSESNNGFLSDIENIEYNYISYEWNKIKIITLFNFLKVNLYILLSLFFKIHKSDTIYINSLLPFGGAIAGKLKGCRVIYHMHEVSIKPRLLKRYLIMVANRCCNLCIHVSHFLKEELSLKIKRQVVISNSLPQTFIDKALDNQALNKSDRFTILMICSLKDFKGIPEFIRLSTELPEMRFILVLNASLNDVEKYFSNYHIPKNLYAYPSQKDVHPYYQRASVVVNLSRTNEWLETFGMTVLEGMYYGKPCIVPTKGGASELIHDDYNGYRIDGNNIGSLKRSLMAMEEDPGLYQDLSENSLSKASHYTPTIFKNEIVKLFNG
ncbi:glycosyltransferase family 4 protein [Fulvivirga ligni]|uniref:glycosyltransferase family 4 protein n=1 Tax=Fulvivirga ligni TaxID=2904246 RepID=UPI001F35F4AE|nr:glycosyltransferase family 4 protein [Fulvivirga ligni]UII21336.1 glycosyltransferase family 4 protein [Fulvivirga ligni]